MNEPKIAVVGIGATGSVLAAALLSRDPNIICVDPKPGLGDVLLDRGISISGAVSYQAPVRHFLKRCGELKEYRPQLIFLSSKTFHLPQILNELKDVVDAETRLVSTHNGLGTEDLIADAFGAEKAFRMSLNFGVSMKNPGIVEAAFFNRPNYLGCLNAENREIGLSIAQLFTDSELDTDLVDDIKLFVWRKMIHKCSLASICAVTDRTIREVLEFPPTREIADGCFAEALAVAKAAGYDLGENYIEKSMGYLENVGHHKDSMCQDIINRTPTEIDSLGGKVVEYGRQWDVPTPFFSTMTNLVRSLEDGYLK